MSDAEEKLGATVRRHSIRLGLFALGAALLLSLVSMSTEDRITAQRKQAEREALDAVLPPAAHDNDLLDDSFVLAPDSTSFAELALLGLSTARTAYIAKEQGQTSGFILPVETPDGYSGTIVLLAGIDTSGELTGVRALQHGETPGLGDKIDIRKSTWILGFDGHSLLNTGAGQWQVKKDGGEFDQFVGATITPRAVVAAVHNALLFFAANRDQLLNLQAGNKPVEDTP